MFTEEEIQNVKAKLEIPQLDEMETPLNDLNKKLTETKEIKK